MRGIALPLLVLGLGLQVRDLQGFAGDPTQLETPILTQLEALHQQRRWNELLDLAAALPGTSPDSHYFQGMALAGLGDSRAAERAFLAGARLAPGDGRFPLELAGLAYRTGELGRARRFLRQALSLDESNPYANDFMATLFYLEGRTAAAVRFWNRNGEPVLQSVDMQPDPSLDPILLNRVIKAVPGEVLTLHDLNDSTALLDSLGLYSRIRPELAPIDDDTFSLDFHLRRRSGIGDGRVGTAVAVLGDLPFQTLRAPLYNLDGAALNVRGAWRWDPHKRRLELEVARPIVERPEWRWRISTDLRREDWLLNPRFLEGSTLPADFNLERDSLAVELTRLAGSRWSWTWQTGLTRRHYKASGVEGVLDDRFIDGTSLEVGAASKVSLIDRPDRAVRLQLNGSAGLERILNSSHGTTGALRGGFEFEWSLDDSSEDWTLLCQGTAGGLAGPAPLDRLFSLGLDQDQPGGMRAHIGTSEGIKGNAPLGTRFFLLRSQIEKRLYRLPLLDLKLAPFLDVGRVDDPSSKLGSRGWLTDAGIELKLASVAGLSFNLSFGRDLSAGRSAVYAYSPRR